MSGIEKACVGGLKTKQNMINGLELVKLYSEIENEDQRLFSEVDESLYEKAFCEGYEYAQREFARANYEGLLPHFKDMLKEERSKIAKNLNTSRNFYNSKMKNIAKSDILTTPEKLKSIGKVLDSKDYDHAIKSEAAKSMEDWIRGLSNRDSAKVFDFLSRH